MVWGPIFCMSKKLMFLSFFDGIGSLKKKKKESPCIRKLDAAFCNICESEILGLYHSHVLSICVHQWTLHSLYPVVLKISKHFMNNNFLRCKLLETQSFFFFLRWENMIRYSGKMGKRNLTCVQGQIWRVRCEETGGKTRFPLVSGGKVYKNNIKQDYLQWHWKMINPYYLPWVN